MARDPCKTCKIVLEWGEGAEDDSKLDMSSAFKGCSVSRRIPSITLTDHSLYVVRLGVGGRIYDVIIRRTALKMNERLCGLLNYYRVISVYCVEMISWIQPPIQKTVVAFRKHKQLQDTGSNAKRREQ